MLSVSQIDDDLSVYKSSKVIIWGISDDAKRMYDLLSFFKIEIFAFCDSDRNKWETDFLARKVLSPETLISKEWRENVLIQIGCTGSNEEKAKKELELLNIENYITSTEANRRLGQLRLKSICHELGEDSRIKIYRKDEEILWNGYFENLVRYLGLENCFLLLPAKTGNGTLHSSLGASNIAYCDLGHQIRLIEEVKNLKKGKKIKLISAVREPISQNLSYTYQMMTGRRDLYSGVDEAWKNGGNIQALFNLVLNAEGYIFNTKVNQKSKNFIQRAIVFKEGLIQNFISTFCKEILNVMKYPFDKQKGYTIITHDNIEIFIYQLEKMNDVWPLLAEWLGAKEIKLVKSNMADEKWCKESYKQAAQDIVISKQYFDKCYNELYVKHFYSEDDIKIFKSRWMNCVR